MPFKTLIVALCNRHSEDSVTVDVHGVRPKNMLLLIHEAIEGLITEFFSGIQYEYKIPCPYCLEEVDYMFPIPRFRPLIKVPPLGAVL